MIILLFFPTHDSEVYLSLLWSSGWLVFAAIMGITCLFAAKESTSLHEGRRGSPYSICLHPLVFLARSTLRRGSLSIPGLLCGRLSWFRRSSVTWSRNMLIGLVALSVVMNSLATVSWLINADQNVPAETRAAWEKVLGRSPMRN